MHLFQCDFLKIDCEGCEFKIITSKHKAMLSKIKKIVLEYHLNSDCDLGRTPGCLTNTLIKAGFKVDIFPEKNVENIGILTAVKFIF